MSTNLPPEFVNLLRTSSLELKHKMLYALSEDIALLEVDNLLPHPFPNTTASVITNSNDMSSFTDHVTDLPIDENLSKVIREELASLKLKTRGSNGNPAKVKTQWLSPSSESYNYGRVVNRPKPIKDYPGIEKLRELVNKHPSSTGDLDAALVSCFSTSRSHLRLHADDEPLISQTSSICTVSFGPPRNLDFVWRDKVNKAGNVDITADLSLPAVNHSMNIMKPGCQAVIKHRVPEGTHLPGVDNTRYSISFRKIVRPDAAPRLPRSRTPPPPRSPPTKTNKSLPKKSAVLIAGDSFPERLDTSRLSRQDKKSVYNIAKGGSKIDVVLDSIKDFVDKNPHLDIKKLIVSIGTNDIRYCQSGLRHLRTPTSNFMKNVKELLPSTKVYFQSLLPIPTNGCPHMERNVLEMNDLIFNMCVKHDLFYIDVFSAFLDRRGCRNTYLFPAHDVSKNHSDIHPNARGNGLLARFYIYIIHCNKFNPLGY